MPVTEITVDSVLIGAAETTIGQVPLGKGWNIAVVRFTNVDVATRKVTIYVYPTSGAADDQHTEGKEISILANSTYEHGPVIIGSEAKITGIADVANKISARIHGWEVTP